MACGGHLLGWEAETGLTALPCVRVDLSVAPQEAAVRTELGRLHCHQWGAGTDSKCKHPSTLQCAEVSQIFPFLSFLKSCVVSSLFFLVLAHPEAATILERAESCLQPGCLSQGQISSAAVLKPLPTLLSPSGRGSVHLAVPAASIFDSCWLCFHCLQGLDCVTLTASRANLLLIWG